MVQQYNSSNQAKTKPVAGYARNLPKGAPPVPTFLPAKTPPPAATSVARTAVPPRAGGELTKRVADTQDYSRAYAQARAQQAAPPPAYRPGTQPGAPTPAGIRQPVPAMARGTILGPAGSQPAGQPPAAQVGDWSNMALPPAVLPQQDIAQQLAAARAGMPTYEQMSALQALPGSAYEPLYAESPGGEVAAQADAASDELAAAMQKYKELYGEQGMDQLQQLIEKWRAGEELSEGQYNLLEEIGLISGEETIAAGMEKVSKGDYHLSPNEYQAMRESGDLPTPEGFKWEKNESGNWELKQMSEDEYLDWQMDQAVKDIADDTKFYESLDAYAAQMERQLTEAQFLAGGQMSSAGLWQTGLGARRMMQVESAAMAEMSATMSDMIVQHQQAKWQAKLQWLQGKTSLWAQRAAIEMQATLSAFNAAMQGADTFMAWLDANGMGDYMDEYWAKVKVCQEAGDVSSITCVFSLFEDFRVDHEGNLGHSGKSAEELFDINSWKEAKGVEKCGNCWNLKNWSCCLGQSDADEEFKHTAPNPASGKVYKAGGKKAYG